MYLYVEGRPGIGGGGIIIIIINIIEAQDGSAFRVNSKANADAQRPTLLGQSRKSAH